MNDLGDVFRLAPGVVPTGGVVEDHHVGLVRPADLNQAAEKRRQAPELVLAPTVEGVVVALGAIQPAAHEKPDLFPHHFLGTGGVVLGGRTG